MVVVVVMESNGRKEEERVRDFGLMEVEIDGEVKELRSLEEDEVAAGDEIAIEAEEKLGFVG